MAQFPLSVVDLPAKLDEFFYGGDVIRKRIVVSVSSNDAW